MPICIYPACTSFRQQATAHLTTVSQVLILSLVPREQADVVASVYRTFRD